MAQQISSFSITFDFALELFFFRTSKTFLRCPDFGNQLVYYHRFDTIREHTRIFFDTIWNHIIYVYFSNNPCFFLPSTSFYEARYNIDDFARYRWLDGYNVLKYGRLAEWDIYDAYTLYHRYRKRPASFFHIFPSLVCPVNVVLRTGAS